jgi:hypothetical protein
MELVWKKSDLFTDSWSLVIDGAGNSIVFSNIITTQEGEILLYFPFLKNNSALIVKSVGDGKEKARECLKDQKNLIIWGVLVEA